MKSAPAFTRVQMAYLKALLTPDCCHVEAFHEINGNNANVVCTRQKAAAYDKLCRYVGIAPAAKAAERCEVCSAAMKERAKETNRTRMRATRKKQREERG